MTAAELNSRMQITIRQTTPQETETVSSILNEAAGWLEQVGMPLWPREEISTERIAVDVAAGLFVFAEISGEQVGTIKLQLEDPEIWPDVPAGESAFIHRLAVRRRFAGLGISTALLDWAVRRTTLLPRRYLRMDCHAGRPRLRAIYEHFGFQFHSERQIRSHLVARYQFECCHK
jgi:GNAT superfamily N-acetyltransferase